MLPAPSKLYQVTEIMLSAGLQQQIVKQLGEQTGAKDWVITGPVIEARECILHKASSATYPHAIAIKVYRDQKKRKNNAMPQYAALERFAPLLNEGDSEYRVPVAYGSFPEQRTFLMEWVEALSLEHRLWRYCYHAGRQQYDMRRTFGWLKAFHQHADHEVKPANINRYRNRLQQFIQLHEGQSLLVNSAVFRAGVESINHLADQFRGINVDHARLHGDFTPSNMLMGDDVVTAIDIAGAQLLPVAEDICLQLSYIAIGYPNMLTRGDMKKPPSQWPLLTVILDAYGYPHDDQQRCFLLYVFLYQLLRRWAVIESRNKGRRTPLLDRWGLRNSEMIVAGVCKTLEKTCHRSGDRSV